MNLSWQLNNQADRANWVAIDFCRVVGLTALVFLGAACTDGYPQEDELVLDPKDMTQLQRLEKMNELGDKPYLDLRWRYKLTPPCNLEITAAEKFGSKTSTSVPLSSAQVKKSYDSQEKSNDIHLMFEQSSAGTSVPVLEGAKWLDAMQLISVLQHVIGDCDDPGQ